MATALCEVRLAGRMEYEAAWRLQEELAQQRLAGTIPDTLLLLEHPPTLTLGRGASAEHVVASEDRLRQLGVTVVQTNRGGDVTYHGPGQLVGYPILNLNSPPHLPDLHRYLRNLEETLIVALAEFGITAGRFPGYTGVWTNPGQPSTLKVAAIGIRTSRWITQHGFALNVSTNLSHFDLIVPCGIHDYGVTSLSQILDRDVKVEDAIQPVIRAFSSVFNMECQLI